MNPQNPILVVEDDPASRDIISQLLRHEALGFDMAESAEEALVMAGQSPYRLAIIDLALPQLDGWQLLQRLQADPTTQSIRAIALTAYYDSQVARAARRAGFLACVPKPATRAFMNRVRSFL